MENPRGIAENPEEDQLFDIVVNNAHTRFSLINLVTQETGDRP